MSPPLQGRVEALEQACKSCHHVIQVLLSSNLELSRRLESLEGPRVATDTTSQVRVEVVTVYICHPPPLAFINLSTSADDAVALLLEARPLPDLRESPQMKMHWQARPQKLVSVNACIVFT